MEPALTKKEKLTSMDPDWTKMPTDILELVCKCLRMSDQLRFGSVSMSWRSSTSNKAYIWVPDTPWLIVNEDNRSKFRLYSSTERKNFKIDKPFEPLQDSFIVGSFKGWLVIRSEVEVFILNIFSRIRIELPPQSSMPDVLKARRTKTSFSIYKKGTKPPAMDIPVAFTMTTCDGFNPIIVATVTAGGDLTLCKIGDKAWKGYRGGIGEEYAYGNLAFHKGKLYAIRRDGRKIDMFQIENESPMLIPLGSIDYPSPPHPEAEAEAKDPTETLQFYLVESKGSLLVVKRYYGEGLNEGTIGFHILKVEENCSQHKLVNVDNLDGQALFLSDLNSESFPAEHCPGLEGDRIYYISYSASSSTSELGVFLVKRRARGRHIRVPLPHTNMEYSPFWVLPRFAFECKCKCHDYAPY